MKKHKTKEEWIKLFKKYESNSWDWNLLFITLNASDKESTCRIKSRRGRSYKEKQMTHRFLRKYNDWKISDNSFMNKKPRKRHKTNKEINDFIENLTDKEKEIIIREHIKRNEEEKSDSQYGGLSMSKKAFVKNVHRTTLYKNPIPRKYKFDFARKIIEETFIQNHKIYGSKRLSICLERKGVEINERTLRRYMSMWGLVTKTRRSKRKSENKNLNVSIPDIVQRNFNPEKDTIVSTDVSYIPAKTDQNNIYLSIAISHKTKMIESWELSDRNNNKLVIDTLNNLKRTSQFILHSDHGFQYSSEYVKHKVTKKYITSMGRIGNSLDNRESEYFFSCLKGEYLKFIKTWTMNLEEIRKHISWYINWYNKNRIQSRLQWKAPTEVSAYAI